MQLLHSRSAPLLLHRQKYGFRMTWLISNQVPEQQNKDLINGLIYILNDTLHTTDNFFYNFKHIYIYARYCNENCRDVRKNLKACIKGTIMLHVANLYQQMPLAFEHTNPHFQKSRNSYSVCLRKVSVHVCCMKSSCIRPIPV